MRAVNQWGALEHSVYRVLKSLQNKDAKILNRKLVLAVSGGVDSIVLLHVMAKLRPAINSGLRVLHFHHGPSDAASQDQFRMECSTLVENETLNLGLEFQLVKYEGDVLRSEAQMREWRLSEIKKFVNPEAELVVTAHHLDDLLETRLIRLIRGTGLSGLRSMKTSGKVLRPFLSLTKSDLVFYAQEKKLRWCDDPSNEKTEYLRNWLRHRWLPELEEFRPGSRKRLGLSLSLICEEGETLAEKAQSDSAHGSLENFISRLGFAKLSEAQRQSEIRRVLGQITHRFSSSQIKEIVKRLDTQQKELTFEVSHTRWILSKDRIMVEYLP